MVLPVLVQLARPRHAIAMAAPVMTAATDRSMHRADSEPDRARSGTVAVWGIIYSGCCQAHIKLVLICFLIYYSLAVPNRIGCLGVINY